jgi:peptide deformylase
MAKLTILEYPDRRLRIRALPVPSIDDALQQFIEDLLETMYAANGVGLAATQVNVAKRVLVIDLSETRDQPLCLINPEILSSSGRAPTEEGCLSVPGIYEKVERATAVRVRALGRDGISTEFDAEGLLAVCVQHEIDHLDGKVFVDYLSELKRQLIRKRLEKEQRQRTTPARSRSATPAI